VLLLIAFTLAALCAVWLGAVVRRAAPAVGAVVPPRADRWHDHPTPTMGGIAIATATALGFLVVIAEPAVLQSRWPDTWVPVPIAAIAMFVVGILDDRLQLSPLAKLVSSLIVGAFLVFALSRTLPEGLTSVQTLVATVWFAGLCHAVNLLDNMDGLAAGVALIAAVVLALILFDPLGPALVVLLTALAGALLGFLYWNRNRARLFMGDCGSLFIGALLAGTALVPVVAAGQEFLDPALLAVIVLVVPLFDTAFVLVLRRLAGRPATRGGTDHVSHRLVSLGFSERSAVRVLYLLGLVGGITAWALQFSGVDSMLPLAALFGVLVILLGIYLARVPAYNAEDFVALQKSSFAPFLKDLTFRWHAGQVMLDLVLISACYYMAYRLRFEGESLENFLPSFTASLPMVLGLKLASLYVSGLYQRSWGTFGLRDLTAVLRGVGLGSILSVLSVVYLYRLEGFSRLVFILDFMLLSAAVVATRASFRTMNLVATARSKRNRRVLVYGAGAFGQLLVREMRANADWSMNPVAFIDDDPMKARRWIVGVPVRGALEELDDALHRYEVDEVILSSPAINGSVEQRIREVCGMHRKPVRRLHMSIR
jgi:UDP-GlcNAc:undecaprenyl-phosphate/decaprenyl-phosphate GlcNAc-1-phosphate transferase